MAKLSAWLVTLIGVLWAVDVLDLTSSTVNSSDWMGWLVALAFLVMGIGKIMRNYKAKGRR